METLHQPGDIISDRYRIVTPLGQGGMGTTYEAEDLSNYKRVALKALSLRQITDWKVLELFEREAKILANLDHPAIPKYLDYFHLDTQADRRFYLIRELVAGESLADLVEKGWHGNEDEVKRIAIQVLKILDYLHQLTPPVIHRDIKPQNIIRCPDGRVFLVDFGAVQDIYRNTFTRSGTFVGTLGYMPPEQFRGQVFFASDLYALGATLLFLLTHRSPVDLPQQRMKIDFRDRVQISNEFADWLEQMLEPTVEDRFKSASEALKALRGERLMSRSTSPIHQQQPLPGRLPRRWQPRGSCIALHKTQRRLIVNIPPTGLRLETLGATGFALFWNGFVFCWTATVIWMKAGIFFLLFSIPFWLVGLGLIWRVLFSIVGSSYLEIDSKNFRIGWKCLGFGQEVKGRTADIERVELDVIVGSKGQTTTNAVIWEGIHQRRFASEVTPVEKEWLVTQVSDFLQQLRCDRA